MTETVQEEKPKVETIIVKPGMVRQKRQFAGFDIDLAVSLPDLVLRVPVKYEKISSKIVKEKLVIRHRVGNVEVSNKPSPYSPVNSPGQNQECEGFVKGAKHLTFCYHHGSGAWPNGAGSTLRARKARTEPTA